MSVIEDAQSAIYLMTFRFFHLQVRDTEGVLRSRVEWGGMGEYKTVPTNSLVTRIDMLVTGGYARMI